MKSIKLITYTALITAILAGALAEVTEAQTRGGYKSTGSNSRSETSVDPSGESTITTTTEVSVTLFSDGVDDFFSDNDSLGFFPEAVAFFKKTQFFSDEFGNPFSDDVDVNVLFDYKNLDLRAELVSPALITYTFESNGNPRTLFSLDFPNVSFEDFGFESHAETLDKLTNDLPFISANLFNAPFWYFMEPFPGLGYGRLGYGQTESRSPSEFVNITIDPPDS